MEKARSIRCGGRTVRYGAKGAKVMPGTPKGDAYCARSLGQMRDFPAAAKDPCSPLRLSRKRWACKGAVSMKLNPVEDDNDDLITPSITLAPLPNPFGDITLFDEDELEALKTNPVDDDEDGDEEEDSAVPREYITPVATAVTSYISSGGDKVAALEKVTSALRNIMQRLDEMPASKGRSWRSMIGRLLAWIDDGMPVPQSGNFESLNESCGSGYGTTPKGKPLSGWPVFMMGNSKLPYLAFSTLPGTTCPGAGDCLTKPGREELNGRAPNGGWCYSFKAWRYPATVRRQVGNTLLMASAEGRAYIAKVFNAWAALVDGDTGQNIVRLYVDGDIHSVETLRFWMELCKSNPGIRAYGYSKSWHIFDAYQKKENFTGWPDNYTVNLSSGAKSFSDTIARAKMAALPVSRNVFNALKIDKDAFGKKIPQNIITVAGCEAAIRRLEATIADGDKEQRAANVQSVKGALARAEKDGRSPSELRRLQSAVRRAVNREKTPSAKRLKKYRNLLVKWNQVLDALLAAKSTNAKLDPTMFPEEFWIRNPDYTAAVKKAAEIAYPRTKDNRIGYFICPGKCGNCLGNGLHACGEMGLNLPVVIGIH